jgi:hypothetical protein
VRLKETITTGRVASYMPRNPKHKPSWMVTVQRREYLIWLLDQVAPVLCSRRREAAALLLSNFKDSPTLPGARDPYGTLSDAEACAWLAGVVEGDGVIRPGDLSVSSVDRDVVLRHRSIPFWRKVRDSNPRRCDPGRRFRDGRITDSANLPHRDPRLYGSAGPYVPPQGFEP